MSEREELDAACDCAPFDRVEAVARRMCEEAGGEWDRPRTRKAHWRAQAALALAGEGKPGLSLQAAGVLALSGWLVAAASLLIALAVVQ